MLPIADILKSLLICGVCLLTFDSFGQLLNQQSLLLQPNDLLDAEYSQNGNDASINQMGNQNELEFVQIQEAAEGNLARVMQSGQYNYAIISQTGGGNQLALLQNGEHNCYILNVEGTGNQLIAIQDGQRNVINQSIINSDNIRSEMIQIGNDNEINTILEGIQGQEFIIRQIGDGLRATITQSSYWFEN